MHRAPTADHERKPADPVPAGDASPATGRVRVRVVGLTERARAALTHLMRSRPFHVDLIPRDDPGDVVLIDLDRPDAWQTLQQLGPTESEAVVGLSLTRPTEPVDHWIRKPVDADELLQALSVYTPSQTATPVRDPAPAPAPVHRPQPRTPEPRVENHAPGTEPRRRFDRRPPTARAAAAVRSSVISRSGETPVLSRSTHSVLLDLATDAVDQVTGTTRTVAIENRVGQIVLNGAHQTASVPFSDSLLCRFARDPDVGWRLHRVRRRQRPDHRQPTRTISFEQLLWSLGVWTYGANPPPDAMQVAARLRRWPDLTRCLALPNDAALAAAWTARSLTPAQAAALLQVSDYDARTFASGAYAAGLLDTSATSTDSTVPRGPDRRRALFASILHRIRR